MRKVIRSMQRITNNVPEMLCRGRDLNSRPPLYECGATNQLSYPGIEQKDYYIYMRTSIRMFKEHELLSLFQAPYEKPTAGKHQNSSEYRHAERNEQ